MTPLINMPLLKEQLKRFWLMGVLLTLVYLPFIPRYDARRWEAEFFRAQELAHLFAMSSFAPVIAMLIAPFAAVMLFYPYYFSKQAADAFYTFPINKKQLFWTNVVSGLILILIPLIIFCILLLMPIHYYGPIVENDWQQTLNFAPAIFGDGIAVGAVMNTFPIVAGFFARMAVGALFYFSLFLLASSVSGNRIVAILLCGAIPFIPTFIHALVESIGRIYVLGFDGFYQVTIMDTMSFTNAMGWGHWITQEVSLAYIFLVYIGITAILTITSYICSHKRKLEKVGESVVFDTLVKVCVFSVSMVIMIVVGVFSLAIAGRVGSYIGPIIGFVVGYIIAQMIAERSFAIGHKIKGIIPYGGVMVGLYLLMLFVVNVGFASYVNHVPQAQQVAGVSLSNNLRWMEAHLHVFVEDEETINQTIQMHQQILANRRYLQDVHWGLRAGDNRNTVRVPFTYLLHDGSRVQRSYVLSSDFLLSSGLGQLVNSPQMRMTDMPALNRAEVISTIHIHAWNNRENMTHRNPFGRSIQITGYEEISSLFEALRKDYIIVFSEEWEQTTNNMIYGVWEPWVAPETEISFGVDVYQQYRGIYQWHFWLRTLEFEYAEHTLEWLAQRGYYMY